MSRRVLRQELEDRIARLVATADGMDDEELEAQIAGLVAASETMKKKGKSGVGGEVEKKRRRRKTKTKAKPHTVDNVLEEAGGAEATTLRCEIPSLEKLGQMIEEMATPTPTLAKKEEDADASNNEFGWIQSVVAETVVVASSPHQQGDPKNTCTDASKEEGNMRFDKTMMDAKSPRRSVAGCVKDTMTEMLRNKESREDDSMVCNTIMGKDDGKRDGDFMAHSDMAMDAREVKIGGEQCDDDVDESERDYNSKERERNNDSVASSANKSDGEYDCDHSEHEHDDDSVSFSVIDKDGSICDAEPGTMDTDVVEHCDVIILGAGAAGIGAARSLLASDASLKVIVIEARNRPGGRAWTSDELGSGVELDHGAKLVRHGSTSTSPKTLDFDAMDSDTDNDDYEEDDASLTHNDAKIHPDPNKKYRMMWNTEGYLERVRVRGANAKYNDTTTRHTVDLGHIHHKAGVYMYKELCRFIGPESQIESIKEQLPRKATYKDCLDELASREKSGQTFQEWMYSRAEKVLQFLMQRDNVELLPQPYDVLQVIATLHLKLYHFYEDYERIQWAGILEKLTCGEKKYGRTDATARGYGQLLKMLATEVPASNDGSSKTIDVRYNQQAISVFQTSEGTMEVSTIGQKDREYIAQVGCICAVPLGVLQQHEKLVFDPPLPDELTSSLNRLSIFQMNKIEILFPVRWWPAGTGTLDLSSHTLDADKNDDFQHCHIPWAQWIIERDDPAIIVCYASHDFAERIEALTDNEVQSQAIEALRSAFVYRGSNISSIPDPVRTYCTRWNSDPQSRGAWTVAPAGVEGMKDVSAFQQFNKEDDRNLFFAGEHTCDASVSGLDIGTVHGAYISGVNAASELLRQKNRVNVYQLSLLEAKTR